MHNQLPLLRRILAASILPLANPGAHAADPRTTSSGKYARIYTNAGASGHRFFKVTRTALANYDPVSGTATNGGGGMQGISTVSPTSGNAVNGTVLTITLNSSFNPAPPPNNVPPTAVTLVRGVTTLTAISSSRNTTTGSSPRPSTCPASRPARKPSTPPSARTPGR